MSHGFEYFEIEMTSYTGLRNLEIQVRGKSLTFHNYFRIFKSNRDATDQD